MKRKYLTLSFLFLFLSLVLNNNIIKNNKNSKNSKNDQNCLIIHGGGITGFWSTLGKLKKINFKDYSEIHCYSSGCLAVIVKVNNYRNLDVIINKSIEIKQTIYTDYYNFYNIRQNFINFLIDDYHKITNNLNLSVVSSNLMTQCSYNIYNFNYLNKTHLKEKMLDSTYIPMITGYYVENRKFYDGSFCQFNLPNCKYNLYPNLNLFNLRNIFNFDLSLNEIEKLLLDEEK